jgi:hypothetical protein
VTVVVTLSGLSDFGTQIFLVYLIHQHFWLYFSCPVLQEIFFTTNKSKLMAKESIAKENPVVDALRRLKDEEGELLTKLKPLQEAIGALERIVDRSVKKVKQPSGTKDSASDTASSDESTEDSSSEA